MEMLYSLGLIGTIAVCGWLALDPLLTLGYDLARQHGGELTASNRPDGGAAFTLWFPFAEIACDQDCEPQQPVG